LAKGWWFAINIMLPYAHFLTTFMLLRFLFNSYVPLPFSKMA